MPVKDDPMHVDARAIRQELERMASFLTAPVTLNLIGGCNMALRGIKASTKDADAVLEPATAWGAFVAAMEDNKYAWTDRNEVIQEMLDKAGRATLQGWATVQGPVCWDLFPAIDIFDGLQWSTSFQERAEPYLTDPMLKVNLADLDSVFMLKAVTGRWRSEPDRDIDDLQSILAAGRPDWDFINAEWQRQLTASRRPDRLRSTAKDAMDILTKRGYRVKWAT